MIFRINLFVDQKFFGTKNLLIMGPAKIMFKIKKKTKRLAEILRLVETKDFCHDRAIDSSVFKIVKCMQTLQYRFSPLPFVVSILCVKCIQCSYHFQMFAFQTNLTSLQMFKVYKILEIWESFISLCLFSNVSTTHKELNLIQISIGADYILTKR